MRRARPRRAATRVVRCRSSADTQIPEPLEPVLVLGLDGGVTRFSAAEITEAYASLHERVQGYVDTGDWTDFALNFTEDATYVEHAFGTFHGRDAIREWSVATMTSFPGSVMTGFPLAWQVCCWVILLKANCAQLQ